MKTIVALLFACLPLLAQSPAAGPANDLLGKWRSELVAQGQLGTVLDFQPGGILTVSQGALADLAYRIENGELILPPAIKGGPEQRQRIEWVNPSKLLLHPADLPPVEFTRVGPAPKGENTLVGEWTTLRELNGRKIVSTFRFLDDNTALLWIPLASAGGKYTVQGETIRLELPDSPPVEGPFRIRGNQLILPTQNGTPATFLRD